MVFFDALPLADSPYTYLRLPPWAFLDLYPILKLQSSPTIGEALKTAGNTYNEAGPHIHPLLGTYLIKDLTTSI